MDRYICIHGHFYQPPRENPWLEEIELQDSAFPYHDWNERVTAECYARNAASRILGENDLIVEIVNNYGKSANDVYLMLHNGSSSGGQLPAEVPKPPAGWKRFVTQSWPKPKPREVVAKKQPQIGDFFSMTLATDRKEYTQHEQVRITVTLTNKTDKDITFDLPEPMFYAFNITMRHPTGSGILGEFEGSTDVFHTDPMLLKAGKSFECTRTVGTFALGEHVVGGVFRLFSPKWPGMLSAKSVTFVTRKTADSDQILKAKFDRQIAGFRRKLPFENSVWQWGVQLGPGITKYLIAELERSGDVKFRNRMGWALKGIVTPKELPFFEKKNLQSFQRGQLDKLLMFYHHWLQHNAMAYCILVIQ
ncbi:hypothetical protein LCGC14_2975210, partial [marine sediment metagenome]